jgi:ABC-type glycerol-3-phosphate transport system substrate-binding protein
LINPSIRQQIGRSVLAAILPAVVLILAPGCGGTNNSQGGPTGNPFDGVTLTLSCPDPAFAAAITPLANTWSARTGAKVTVSGTPMTPDGGADIGVIAPTELGTWADRDGLQPVPTTLQKPDHFYQWLSVVQVYQGHQFAGWGPQTLAVPLAGDGRVLVYRADRFDDPQLKEKFQKQSGLPLAAPAAWEDFAAAAAFFTATDGRPSLPALPAADAELADEFFRVAACYDRVAISAAGGGDATARPEQLAFQFHHETDNPRLDTPGFVEAARWLQQVKPSRSAEADPVAALAAGRVVLAVVSLAELGRLRDEVARQPKGTGVALAKFGIAPVPGSRRAVIGGGLKPVPPNYVPYFSGGRLGVVRTTCAHPEAAFDLLADLGGPTRSLELVGTPGLGVGPFRTPHFERDRLLTWYAYGFDEDRTKALQDAAGAFVGRAVKNPAFALRGPDHAALTAALAAELRPAAAGTVPPEEAMKRAVAAWEKVDANTPPAKLREWRRKAAGLGN